MIDEIIERELVTVTLEAVVDVRTGELAGCEVRWRPPAWLPGARARLPLTWRALADQAFEEGRLLGLQHLAVRKAIDAVAQRDLPRELRVHLPLDPRLLFNGGFCLDGILDHARRRGAKPARLIPCISGPVDRVRALARVGAPLGLDYAGAPLDDVLRLRPHVVRLLPCVTRGIHADPRGARSMWLMSAVARAEMIDVVAVDVASPHDVATLEEMGIHAVHLSRVARIGAPRRPPGDVPVTVAAPVLSLHEWHADVIPA